MPKDPIYSWDAEEGIAQCVLVDGNEVFYGFASVHPDDRDLANEYTGLHIAENRAMINALQYRKNYVITPSLKALKHLYCSMQHSTHFNPKSYEAKMLNRQIQLFEDDLEATKETIAELKEYLKTYIQKKDEAYKAIRKHGKNMQITLDEIE